MIYLIYNRNSTEEGYMNNHFKRILLDLLYLAIVFAAILFPLLRMGVLYSNKALYFQNLSSFSPNISYEDQITDAQMTSLCLLLIAGVFVGMLVLGTARIFFGDRFKLVVTDESHHSTKPISTLFVAIFWLFSVAFSATASWKMFSLGFSYRDNAKEWKANPGSSGRVTELHQKIGETFHDLSTIYLWWGSLAAMFVLYMLIIFYPIVRSKKLNTDKVESSKEGVEPAADEVTKN